MPVEVKGLDEVLKAMRQFEPDLAKNLNKQVRAALSPSSVPDLKLLVPAY